MIKITFKDVGQGDSIILEWYSDNILHLGIIDCKLKDDNNVVLDFLKTKQDYVIDFIILTHFHEDHFSGMPDLFKFCYQNKIKVKYFYHTIGPFIGEIYDRVFTSQKTTSLVESFFIELENFYKFIDDSIQINPQLKDHQLTGDHYMSFLAPLGKTFDEMSKQLSRKKNKIVTTIADINKLATILLITHKEQAILLTSDAVKKSFFRIRKNIEKEILLTQVPHHGSWPSVDEKFWGSLKKCEKCPAVFSVGKVPKDKLPNKTTVSFFDGNDYYIHSTNFVYGILDHFGTVSASTSSNQTSNTLNGFSKLRKSRININANRFIGDQSFTLL